MLLLLAVGTGLLGALLPLVTASLFDRAIPGGQRSVLLQLTAGLAVAALVAALFGATRELAILRVTGKMGGAVQAAVIDRLLDLPIAFFRQYTAGDLAGRALGISTMQQLLSGAVLTAMLSGVLSLSSLGVLFLLDARLALVVSALVLALIASASIAGRLELHAQRRLGELAGRLAGVVLQLINGVAKVRVAGAEGRVFALWATAFAEQRRVAYSARVVGNRLAVFNAAYPILASMVVFGAAAVVLDPRPSTATVLAFIVALGQLNIAAAGLMQALGAIVQAVPAYERAQPIFQSLPEVDATRADPGELSGAINLDHVSFRYSPNGPLILDDVSLRFRPGEFVAVVGPSGSGKSTLLRLLLGFEAPESGAILYDGQDLATLDLRSVRRQIGSVLQTSRLMSGDILSNIVGASAATPDDAWEAVHMAGLEQDLREMPMRLQTVITAGGGTLSGGQRQRLLIARAIVARPRILLFDEATSALDNRTQALVSRGLEHLAATRVVIAHRLSTILNADHIYVLQAGRVVESGNYRELMQRRGLFAELARRQIT